MKLSVWFFCFLFGFTLAAQTVWGAGLLSGDDIDFELFVNDRFHFFNGFFDSGRKEFNQDRNFHIFYINSSIYSLLGPRIQGVLEVEAELTYDLDSNDFDDDWDADQVDRSNRVQCGYARHCELPVLRRHSLD